MLDRYRLEVLMDTVGDVAEWMGNDVTLDRAVQVEVLESAATPERRRQFIDRVRGVAGVHHDHLAAVYAAEDSSEGAYAVLEWSGGVTVANRIAAGQLVPLADFLPNAAGLAAALGAIHERGVTHGAIDDTAVDFPGARPAKLRGFARPPRWLDAEQDTAALARVLTKAVAGRDDVVLSETVDGIDPVVDRVLLDARQGKLGATELAAALRGAPTPPAPRVRRSWTWGWLPVMGALLVVALAVMIMGRIIEGRADSSFLYPATPPPGRPVLATTTAPLPPSGIRLTARSHDPLGDRAENDLDLGLLLDEDPTTAWTTERYASPLSEIKAGIGVAFSIQAGQVSMLEVTAEPGVTLQLLWNDTLDDDLARWQAVDIVAVVRAEPVTVALPQRPGGHWLLWMTDLPTQPDGLHYAIVYEVRFAP